MKLDKIYNADCLDCLEGLPGESINLIVTSPPYADNRKRSYRGVSIDKYVEWFLPISRELHRVLRPDGSFVLNIKERVVDGERATYVIELILEMRKQGWLWTEEYLWHKKNCYPGKWPNRFRDAYERCLHFTKQKSFRMFRDDVAVNMDDPSSRRFGRPPAMVAGRDAAKSESGSGSGASNRADRDVACKTNVLHMATECSNVNHSAAFPVTLPSWFIRLLSTRDDVVLDPFIGSGTTAIAAIDLGRHYVGMELEPEYYKVALSRIKAHKPKARKALLDGYFLSNAA